MIIIDNAAEIIENNKPKDERERGWRNTELTNSDWIVPITDHPKRAAYLVYRQELRDYPQQEDFPNGQRPVKP
jgi:hypothetical protein